MVDNTVVKTIENVDELFPEIIVNGESHVSERYVEPETILSQSLPQSSEEQTDTQPQQNVQGEYVDTLNLNGIEHDLKDSPLTAEVQALQTLLSTIQSRLNEINALIPNQASAQNQLADKSFVNSSIATNTANFLGTFTSLADIEAIPDPTNNDYAFLQTTDSSGNNVYDRYKYSAEDEEWLFEYELNNSSFTAEQWATINSGLTQQSVTDEIAQAIAGITVTAVDTVQSGNMNAVTSNAVANWTPTKLTGVYTGSGGKQNPQYVGKGRVCVNMMNTAINGDSQYKDFIMTDCYGGFDAGGATAIGVSRQSMRVFAMRSDAGTSPNRPTSWTSTCEINTTARTQIPVGGTHNTNGEIWIS